MTESYFHQRIVSVMTDNKYDRRVRNKDSGRLDMNRLYKVPTGTSKVFTQKQERKGKRYNISLVVDLSGSMYDRVYTQSGSTTRREIAIYCATILDKHFRNIGINTAIIGYSNYVGVFKTMGATKHVSIKNIEEALYGYGGGGTDTAGGLREGYRQLRNLEGENLVIVMTDGEPNDVQKVKDVIKSNRRIKTLGIGIGINVQSTVGGIVVNDPKDLFEQFINLMTEHIKRN